MSSDLDERTAIQDSDAAERRWKNWFRSDKCVIWHNALPDGPGVWPEPVTSYPTKLAAESAAQSGFCELELFSPGYAAEMGIVYLGAFQTGDRP